MQKRNAELVDGQSRHGVSEYIRSLVGTEEGSTVVEDADARGAERGQRRYSESVYGEEGTRGEMREARYGDGLAPWAKGFF